MDSLQATYTEEDDKVDESVQPTTSEPPPGDNTAAEPLNDVKTEPMSSDSDDPPSSNTKKSPRSALNSATNTNDNDNDTTTTNTTNNNNDEDEDEDEDEDDEEDDEEDPPPKKQKPLSSLTTLPLIPGKAAPMEAVPNPTTTTTLPTTGTAVKIYKKKNNNNVWVTKSTRKGKKKNKSNNHHNAPAEETVLITPIQKLPDKSDDTQDMKICLSRIYKAEKVKLSEDRLSAGSIKGYRMVRATRGVVEGTWYFEIKVVRLVESGHTPLGWSTEKGDLQAAVVYDGNSFGYRDIAGSKVHKALREKYGEDGYKEVDVFGFYIFAGGRFVRAKAPTFGFV